MTVILYRAERRFAPSMPRNRAYGTRYATFADAPGAVDFVEKPFDPCAFDFRNSLNARGYAWCNWPTFDMPTANDISNHGGIFGHYGQAKALTRPRTWSLLWASLTHGRGGTDFRPTASHVQPL